MVQAFEDAVTEVLKPYYTMPYYTMPALTRMLLVMLFVHPTVD